MTPEGKIVAYLKRRLKEARLPFVRMSLRPGVAAGWPDFLILIPGGKVVWVETKAPGKPLRPIQEARKLTIKTMGGVYIKPDSKEDVDRMVLGLVGANA